jgi:hypothetical protein
MSTHSGWDRNAGIRESSTELRATLDRYREEADQMTEDDDIMTSLLSELTCGRIESDSHDEKGRSCVHLLADLPRAVLLGRGPVERLAVNPQVCPAPSPVIASHLGDVLYLAFDHLGPKVGRCSGPGKLRHYWTFRLHAIDEHTVLAIREDTVTPRDPGGYR